MKYLKYIIGVIVLLFLLYFFFTNNATKDKANFNDLAPKEFNSADSAETVIEKISLKELNGLISNINGMKHVYVFSYFCGPCVHSLSTGAYNKVSFKDKIDTLPTILVSCDNYGTLDKLNALALKHNLKIYILDNSEFVSTSNFGTYDRLGDFLNKFFKTSNQTYNLAFPYNLILDAENKVIDQHPGAIVD